PDFWSRPRPRRSRAAMTHPADPFAGVPLEPLTDFSKQPARAAMRAALDAVAGQLGASFAPVIDNRPVTTAASLDSPHPPHKRPVVGRCGRASAEQARLAVEAASRAFPAWRDTPVERRAELLRNAAAVLRRRRFELAAWEVYECAKQWRE